MIIIFSKKNLRLIFVKIKGILWIISQYIAKHKVQNFEKDACCHANSICIHHVRHKITNM